MIHDRLRLNFSQLIKEIHEMEVTRHNDVHYTSATATTAATTRAVLTTKTECDLYTERLCDDGTCISKMDLCPDEQLINQNTILIMVVVGMAVVVFLIILYCFQQRQREANREAAGQNNFEAAETEGDNTSLYQPPPSYEEVITTNLYPPTPQLLRQTRPSNSDEPITPPPNYDVALNILAQSHESILVDKKKKRISPVVRRSVSTDHSVSSGCATNGSNQRNENPLFRSDSSSR